MMPKTKDAGDHDEGSRLFELLLRPELVSVSTLALSAVGGAGREASLYAGSESPRKDLRGTRT